MAAFLWACLLYNPQQSFVRKQDHPAAGLGPKPVKSATRCLLVSGVFGTDLASVPGPGFLTKMSNLHCTLLFSCILSHSIISEDWTPVCGSVRCLTCISLWWQKPLVTQFHPHVVTLRVVLWSRSRDTCTVIMLKKKDCYVAGSVPMAIQMLLVARCQKA